MEEGIEEILEISCGLDVHEEMIEACVLPITGTIPGIGRLFAFCFLFGVTAQICCGLLLISCCAYCLQIVGDIFL